MRRPIETAPKNGVFVILEDAAHGTFAVARWSIETAQWLDDDDKPIQLNATHWNLPQNLDEQLTPRRPDATDRPPPVSAAGTTAQPQPVAEPRHSVVRGWAIRSPLGIAAMAACLLVGAAIGPMLYRSDVGVRVLQLIASDSDNGLKQALEQERERANRLAGDVTAARREVESQAALIHQASEGADRQKEASDRDLAGLRQALQFELSRTETLAGQLAEAQRNGATQTALTRKTIDDAAKERERVIGELRQALKQQEDQTAQARRKGEDEIVQAKQASMRMAEALQQERDKVEELRGALAAARREGEAQAATWRSASSEAARLEEASARATDALREALRQAEDKAEKLAGELATTRRQVEAQTKLARAASDEARRVADTSKQSAEAQSQALREANGKAEKLATELAAARQAVQTQISVADSAKVQAAGIKEAAERSGDEQRRALQQERDRTAKLTAELAETRSSLQAQTKAKAAEDVAWENHLATAREELQKARADAAAARESREAERSRTEQIEQRLVTIEAATRDHGARSLAPAAPAAGQPSPVASSVTDARTTAPAGDTAQSLRSATRSEASVDQASPHAVRLIARANLLLDQGNIGAARNMLDRAAEMGSAEALFWLAETYDPLLLPTRKTFGTQSDITKARDLYGKALAGGVSEARLRLDALQQ